MFPLQCNAATASFSEEELLVADGSSLADDDSGCSSEGIEVHYVGLSFEYTIPSFSCITVILRQIKFCAELDGCVRSYDGFIHNNPCLNPVSCRGIFWVRTSQSEQACLSLMHLQFTRIFRPREFSLLSSSTFHPRAQSVC